jgi:hypothetical protein
VQHIRIAFQPHQAPAQHRLLSRHFHRVQNRRLWNFDVVVQLRIKVQANVPVFRRCSQIPDQQQRIRWLCGVAYNFSDEFIQSNISA